MDWTRVGLSRVDWSRLEWSEVETSGVPLCDFPKIFMRKAVVFDTELQKFKV